MRSRSVLLQTVVPTGLVGALAAVGLAWVAAGGGFVWDRSVNDE